MASPKLFRVPIGGDLAVKASRAIGRSVVRKFLVLIEAGRIVVELPTGDRVERTGRLPGLIQRFVFPGGFLPSKTFLREALERADLKIVAAENFGESNALTLRKWRRRFLEKWPQVEWLGFDAPFRRLWEYYLCYCEAGFRRRRMPPRFAHAGRNVDEANM
jgi:cyclopropane fatty-acyl-phospholipid synthase-like methyltransferase